MNVTFVGTSDAFGAGGRRQAAIFVETTSGGLLLDCAPTTGTGLVALGIPRDAVDAIALSHFHADHFAGLPQFLLAAMYEDRRRHPLVVAGPRGVEARVRGVADAVGYSIEDRTLPFPLRFVEIATGAHADLGPASATLFATRHQPESCPHGIRLRAGERSLVYSGDTGWFDGLGEHARGADLFVCECTFYETQIAEHLTYRSFAEQARGIDCGRLVLTHLGSEMTARRGQLAIETADDGMRLSV